MKQVIERKIGALVNIRWEQTGDWFPARITEIDSQGFRAAPTGAPIKGWLGDNVVLRAWENEYPNGYGTWAWRAAAPE